MSFKIIRGLTQSNHILVYFRFTCLDGPWWLRQSVFQALLKFVTQSCFLLSQKTCLVLAWGMESSWNWTHVPSHFFWSLCPYFVCLHGTWSHLPPDIFPWLAPIITTHFNVCVEESSPHEWEEAPYPARCLLIDCDFTSLINAQGGTGIQVVIISQFKVSFRVGMGT